MIAVVATVGGAPVEIVGGGVTEVVGAVTVTPSVGGNEVVFSRIAAGTSGGESGLSLCRTAV